MTFVNIGGPELASHTWTPVLTADTYDPIGFTVRGNNNYYEKRGDLVLAKFGVYTPNTSGNYAGSPYMKMSLPVQPKHASGFVTCGSFYMFNTSPSYPTDNWSIFGAVVLHDDSQSESTVQFAIYNSIGLSTTFNMIPDGLRHDNRYISMNGYMIYEAL